MTDNNTELDPLAAERERRRKRNLNLPKTGGTYTRREDGTFAVDDNGTPVPDADSVTAPPTGKSDLRRALYAKELREGAGNNATHDADQAQAAFQQAHAAQTVPATRSRRGHAAPADDTNPGEAAGTEG